MTDYTKQAQVDPATLEVGDTFTYRGILTLVLATGHTSRDIFGREFSALKCRRGDTGAEGLMSYGPGGIFNAR